MSANSKFKQKSSHDGLVKVMGQYLHDFCLGILKISYKRKDDCLKIIWILQVSLQKWFASEIVPPNLVRPDVVLDVCLHLILLACLLHLKLWRQFNNLFGKSLQQVCALVLNKARWLFTSSRSNWLKFFVALAPSLQRPNSYISLHLKQWRYSEA